MMGNDNAYFQLFPTDFIPTSLCVLLCTVGCLIFEDDTILTVNVGLFTTLYKQRIDTHAHMVLFVCIVY
jgi:hypothetical protein